MRKGYVHRASAAFRALLPDVSGNAVNGLGDEAPSRPKPSFWHPPDRQPFGALQHAVIEHQRQCGHIAAAYSRDADRGPRPIEKSRATRIGSTSELTDEIKSFARANEADLVGITPVRADYVYEGYDLPLPRLVMIGVAMNHADLSAAPSSIDDMRAAIEIATAYNRAARAARGLANHILAAGYEAKSFPGPMAGALNMIPAAIAAGLGELGKHGSMINRTYGSSFRLSAVATDMPLDADAPDDFGVDEFCRNCQVCTNACPPGAIFTDKQTVRGVEKWYVDFDRCIPYFGETFSCAICIAVCPWSLPGVAGPLIDKLARRRDRVSASARK